ncbi:MULTISPECIES: hypothetical protein [unclassified Brevundimonas]|jgi:hypothetical protein|uniref:hypothetical protein n=1 Tax=unclassified Brevundimonas TaxID=2622653 RepID=UPI000C4546B9|nr:MULTISPECIES: hypothetical protein [unclassified Brevundimonas]MAL87787.1 hypothetical protein [Brevundimonas sp.]HAV50467.1 hypothetical protein [Brevundimonas sp.]|tara:strand:+ start:392 stop:1039 length:648 start_codon:yes stop_codon:yes gene_type:complete
MTACNVWLQGTAGHILSDAAYYDSSGRIVQIASKVVIADHLGIAYMISGCGGHTRLHKHLLASGPTGQQEGILCLPGIAAAIKAENVAGGISGDDADLILVAVTWHQALDQPVAFGVSTGGRQDLGGAGQLIDLMGYTSPLAPLPHPLESGQLDPALHGVSVLEAQRKALQTIDGQSLGTVGGYGELTTVTREAITQSRLIEWNDTVGEFPNVAV